MKKIIVPVDFSEYSEYALETASILAKKNNAEILVLHMLEMSEAILTRAGTDMQMETMFFLKLAEKKFEEFYASASCYDCCGHFSFIHRSPPFESHTNQNTE